MTINFRFKRRASFVAIVTAFLLILFIFAAPGLLQSLNAQRGDTIDAPTRKQNAWQATSEATAESTVKAFAPSSRSLAKLKNDIDRTIDESEFSTARCGVFVSSLRDGRTIYARHADELFTPASNMKVYTTAVALDLLGAGYRWRTSVYAQQPEPDANGQLTGDLTLYGRGAPDLVSHRAKNNAGETLPSLETLADDLYRRGVRRVKGNIVGDESYFSGEALGDGWLWTDVQWYFGAEPSALSIDNNEWAIQAAPASRAGGQASVQSSSAGKNYLRVVNDTSTTERGAKTSIGVTRSLSDNEVRVWGDFPAGGAGLRLRLAMHQPALVAAHLFRDALEARGIAVEGEARIRDAHTRRDQRVDPQQATELAFALSQTLGEIAHQTNKESLNLDAELILRTLGQEQGAAALMEEETTAANTDEASPKKRVRASDESGLAALRQWLERAGIKTKNLALHDGCGLSRLDLVTPEATAGVLAAMKKSPAAAAFFDSLPVAGRDGTLASRLRAQANRIEAKTGTLTYVHSLSGYTTTADGEPLVFSIMCNDETAKASPTSIIDAVAARLASFRRDE